MDGTYVHNITWDNLLIDERYDRAIEKVHIKADARINGVTIEDKYTKLCPDFNNKAFDFYGSKTRIADYQKFKFAETNITMFYKDLIDELLDKYEVQEETIAYFKVDNDRYRLTQKK